MLLKIHETVGPNQQHQVFLPPCIQIHDISPGNRSHIINDTIQVCGFIIISVFSGRILWKRR